MKILHVMDRLNVGGPARLARDLLSQIRPEDATCVLVVGDVEPYEESMESELVESGIDVRKSPYLSREIDPLKDLRAFWHLVQIIRREKPDIVHTHKSKAGVVGRLAARALGVPVVLHTFHGHVLEGYFSARKASVFKRIEAALARITDRIVVLTGLQRKDLLEHGIGKSGQYEVIPIGLDLARFSPGAVGSGILRKEKGWGADEVVIGIVGRLVPIKDHGTFLEAARLVLAKHPAVRFVVVGDGPSRVELEQRAAALGIAARVEFLGNRLDVPQLYPDFDLVTLSSKNEGLPVVLIEAMACERPVVATNVGGVPDVVEEGVTGFLVSSGDHASLADRICRLVDDGELRRRMGRAARASTSPYEIKLVIEKTLSLYRGVLSAKRA